MRGSRLGVALAMSVLTAGSVAAQTLKVGYIDSQAILNEYDGAQQARQEMESSVARYQAELKQMNDDLQKAVEEYQAQQMTLTPEARQNREESLASQQAGLQRRAQELEAQSTRRQAEVFQPVMEEIGNVIEEIRVEGSYAMIFDVASQAILSADPALDLTQEVLRRLQTGAVPSGGR